ncbi:GlxA family transcriptional regulator [Micromonospora siamensis]|uniref:Transcriptional regulator GlxA family, contains an amidase domain and an AraC-type DNA-binding HTH domain n=1 Tax=Micromonospora siamensis TaxID=299152 RepID=A0A1C5GPM7_9ACTN|nr:helix-turn-helix domain-containing protein [Micromonospora siamensis]SCG35725.1 Transcriptional regulator GlxA family, contains an amidase domain and an AraC-type DNA-binding HTH domain [Micromonospora siamensis]
MLRSVAVLALDRVAAFELGVLAEVFGTDRTADGFPGYRFAVCTPDGGPVRTASGFQLVPHADLAPIEEADLVAVPAHGDGCALPEPALAALRRAAERGAWLLSVCAGAFVLGAAGVLDDRDCTTHWRYVDELQRRHPRARVSCNSLYVQDGRLLTSAGTAAGIDACLHLVRQEHGSAVATRLARRMVVPPHRDGGQAQYVEAPIPRAPEAPTLEPVLEWLMGHLDRPVTVEDLAGRAGMAPRTFARRFRAETGTTPHDWVTSQRVLLARRLLEETALSVEEVAGRAGFGDAAGLRHHFTRRVGTTPHSYRATFRARIAAHQP